MQLYSLSPQRLGQIFVADGSTLWTAGFNLQDIPLVPKTYSLRSIDKGVTWISQDMGIQNQITSFSVVDSETAWAVSGDAWRTIDGGTTWVDVSPQLDQGIGAIAALNRDVAWAPYSLRRPNDYLGQTIKTTDGGQNWVIQSVPTNQYLSDIAVVDETTAWVIGWSGVIFKTTDGGDAKPDVLSVSPASATWGDKVTIKGIDFGATRGTSSVAGVENASDYVSWSDTEIVVKVPTGTSGKVPVVVTTAAGSSNPGSLTVVPGMSVTSVTPNWANTGSEVEVTIAGTGFASDAVVSLKSGATMISPTSTTWVSANKITCKFSLTNAAVGTYDLSVSNPGGYSATLAGGFSVNATSPCGFGSGLGMLMLGLSLGLLSLAGSARMKRKYRRAHR